MRRQEVMGKPVEKGTEKGKFSKTQDKMTAQNDRKLLDTVKTGDIVQVKQVLADRTVSREGVRAAILAANEEENKNKEFSSDAASLAPHTSSPTALDDAMIFSEIAGKYKEIADELKNHLTNEAYSRCAGR